MNKLKNSANYSTSSEKYSVQDNLSSFELNNYIIEDIHQMKNSASNLEKSNFDKTMKTYLMQSSSNYSYEIINYVIHNWINENCSDSIKLSCNKSEFQYDYDKKVNIVNNGDVSFVFKNNIYYIKYDIRTWSHKIVGNTPIFEVYEGIQNALETKNPLKRKHIQLVQTSSGFGAIFKKVPNVSFDEVIMNEKLKEDIYDNSIFQLKNLQENNGIILHGIPGTGKSFACQAIVNEAIKEGFSTCFLTSGVNYTGLNQFVEKFLSPCIIIFEDMDSFGRSREDGENPELADFLQFLSGLSESKKPMIFIGTTNYLNMLDDAIANRPVRFNRKFKFELPNPKEIDQLIDLYFGKNTIQTEQKVICHNKNFTGSHLKEINRTAKLLSLKRKDLIQNVFSDAVELILSNFKL